MPVGLTQTELIAVLVAVIDYQPCVMTIRHGMMLPSGPFELSHPSLQSGLRDWIHKQTRHPVGFLEQLYTFADRDRIPNRPDVRTISISYLGLVRQQHSAVDDLVWHKWYQHFPWEDWRNGKPDSFDDIIRALQEWSVQDRVQRSKRERRIAFLFGLDENGWDEDLILQRYELLYEAGLLQETGNSSTLGLAMYADHRRILATAIARLRAKIKYKAVVFELMPQCFTLLHLQKNVEAIIGQPLHKPNFRRMIEQQGLIEETGESESETGGRPAKLFRYRRSILDARALSGSKLPLSRN
ncbi:NUDIX hydrolase [Commensalibacter oyaizuii]|uniref:NrtR DNA-binding winged helix domain-containing protein n=1 Tax=Commensalibacter oyaizuii TaxID=3043873 RepID=A0ABT6PZS0_9PROT|nr:hypothetical protein [Commensalibacter sp. TBRC 16381]MDI2090362.1 hypothetical protein [Commensalibacter sp. TBRC 16381]